MQTTAGQIANYKGDAAAALGSQLGADSGASLVYGDTNLEKVSKLNDVAYQFAIQKNHTIYNRKLKERDELRDLIRSEKLAIPRLLPKDRDIIIKQHIDPIRKLLLNNPDIYSNQEKYLELQNKLQNFQEAKTYGGVRLMEISKMDDEIAKEKDPVKRKKMTDHRNKMYDQDFYGEVKPYQQILGWGTGIFSAPKPIVSSSEKLDGNNLVTTQRTMTPLKEFTDDTWYNYMKNPDTTIKDQMDVFAENFYELPERLKMEKIAQWNEKIEQANKDFGYTPENNPTYYVAPIKSQLVEGPDGVARVLVSATTPEIVRAQAILENYKSEEVTSNKVSKLPAEIAKLNAERKRVVTQADADRALAAQRRSQIPYNQARAKYWNTKASGQQESEDNIKNIFNDVVARARLVNEGDPNRNKEIIWSGDLPAGFEQVLNGIDKDGKPIWLKPKEYANGAKYYEVEKSPYVVSPNGTRYSQAELFKTYNDLTNRKVDLVKGKTFDQFVEYLAKSKEEGGAGYTRDIELKGANGTGTAQSTIQALRSITNKSVSSKQDEEIFQENDNEE